ncbi:MAG: ABC transporter substrate-binding protein [Desulfosarcinaceae bacterium]|nr:ABC transporter substrate-binding protein [Desulfosarcinaceae bacterium]
MLSCALFLQKTRLLTRFAVRCCTLLTLLVAALGIAAIANAGGRLVVGVENNDSLGFDVLKVRGTAISDAFANITIHERLFQLDEEGNLAPMLALSAEPSEDETRWTIRLRQGVRFHDGTPFDADAVVAHWSRMLDPNNKYRHRFTLKPIQRVERVDAHTVRFHLAHPWIVFPRILAAARNLTFTIPSPAAVAADRQHRHPVGTGPFMFSAWRSGDHLTVSRNPHHWAAQQGRLDEIVFRFMPDHQTRFAALRAGDVDLIWMDRGQIIAKAREDTTLKVHHGEDNGAEILILNTSVPPFDDERVRQALAHAWNQPQYVKLNYQDSIPTVSHPFGDGVACGDSQYRAYDLERAKQLLADYGRPVAFECLHSNTQRGREIGIVLQQFGKAVGMAVSPVGLAFGPVVKKVITGDYQASTWRIPSGYDLGPAMSRAFHTRSPGNWSKYGSEALDALLNAQWTTTDPEERRRLLCRIAAELNRGVPILYRGGRHHYVIARDAVQGLPPFQHGVLDLTGVWLETP